MPDYTDQDANQASSIIERLLDRERLDRERRLDDLPKGFSVVDVEAHAEEFLGALELLRWIDTGFPAMEVAGGPPSPVSLAWLLNLPSPLFGRFRMVRFWLEFYGQALYDTFRRGERPFGDLLTLSREQARENFFSRASDFLATRLAALRQPSAPGHPPNLLNMRQYAYGPRTQVAGCQFSVSTNTHGLSAYWSGAYYISSNYHGAPTSPAVGVLQAGTYVFGINGGAYGNQVQWDTNAVCSLPGNTSVHLQY